VIYVGTMSKVLLPALRLGYLVLPPALVEPFAALRTTVDDQGPLVDQAALAAFMDAGAFYGHLRRCRREYGARLDAFLSVAREVDAPLDFPHAGSGMNLMGLWREPPRDLAGLPRRLAALGFDLPSLARYALADRRSGLVFGFSAFAPGAIRAAWRRLGPALR
jgi:GntR family transcriptional regulator/MocR family aminotransferase